VGRCRAAARRGARRRALADTFARPGLRSPSELGPATASASAGAPACRDCAREPTRRSRRPHRHHRHDGVCARAARRTRRTRSGSRTASRSQPRFSRIRSQLGNRRSRQIGLPRTGDLRTFLGRVERYRRCGGRISGLTRSRPCGARTSSCAARASRWLDRRRCSTAPRGSRTTREPRHGTHYRALYIPCSFDSRLPRGAGRVYGWRARGLANRVDGPVPLTCAHESGARPTEGSVR
jgi:hypothetical protein